MDYEKFLASKHMTTRATGISVDADKLCPALMDWQNLVVRFKLRLGRSGCFAGCGLGKSLMQLAELEALHLYGSAKRSLILTPAAVAPQFLREAEKFGIRVATRIIRDQSQADSGINLCNYERLHLLDPSQFDAVQLDEASILKSYMGKTKQALLKAFVATPSRGTNTATPAPNDHLELGNQAEFLGIMPANEMLMRWFINDTMSAGNYRLKHHAADDYWRWVASFAVAIDKPSDLGDFSDEGYILPPLNYQEHVLGEERLMRSESLSATEIHKVKRARAAEWAEYIAGLVAQRPNTPWVNWADTDYEADALTAAIPNAVEVRGSMKIEQKEELLEAFSAGQVQRLVTKAEIAGFGMNWQHCHNTTFPAGYSYERLYQLLRRFYRFGQANTVNAHHVLMAEELCIAEATRVKSAQHELMKSKMSEYMSEIQKDNLHGRQTLKPAPTLKLLTPDGGNEEWTLYHGDCVEAAKALPNDSIDFCIHSPPFSNLYIYSDSIADMGNAADHLEFFRHYEYLIEQLYRVTVPGRLCAVHCKDLPLYKGRDGAAGLFAFPDLIRESFEKCGWILHSRVTIWKDPVTEMQRTKNHGLLHKQLCKDSSASRQGMADFLIVFRKWAEEFPKPVTTGNPFCRFTGYVGEDRPESKPLTDLAATLDRADPYSIQVWQRYASPVWFDINQMRVLNYRLGKEDKDEKHICPLQLDVIERSIDLWTNPGDLVLDPFNGIGSSGYVALKMGRRYIGSELKGQYCKISLDNFATAIKERQDELTNRAPLLPGFDLMNEEATAL